MLELKSYTDEEMATAMNVSLSTLKCKRKITEERHLNDYIWTRDKKKKTYVIHSYEKEIERSALEDTFESLLTDFCDEEVPLRNKHKALKILITIFRVDESLPSSLAIYADESPQEIHRYVDKFRQMDLLVNDEYDYYLVHDDEWEWELISRKEAQNIKDYWNHIFYKQVEMRGISALDPDMYKVWLCKTIASEMTKEKYGILRTVSHKYLNEKALDYFRKFLEYADKEMRLFIF